MSKLASPCSCFSVTIPAYNEEATLAVVVRKVLALEHLLEVFIIDDCSSDRTGAVALALAAEDGRVCVVRHERNRGQTEALKTGFAQTTGEIVIVQDADLESVWFIVRFNLFCNLRSSFRRLPEATRARAPRAGRVGGSGPSGRDVQA
jgi:GT2 family glycosyltransferase